MLVSTKYGNQLFDQKNSISRIAFRTEKTKVGIFRQSLFIGPGKGIRSDLADQIESEIASLKIRHELGKCDRIRLARKLDLEFADRIGSVIGPDRIRLARILTQFVR